MASIEVIHADALNVKAECELIVTDPPFDMNGSTLNKALANIQCDHCLLITTMRQFLALMQCSDWVLGFDIVLDAVVPKKSKSVHQPNYTHCNGFYISRNNATSIFNRKLRQRSDTFDNNGYWPTILRAPRNAMHYHGMAKNETAFTDIIGSFDAKTVYDPFAGSGVTGMACFNLEKECLLVEKDADTHAELVKRFGFLGATYKGKGFNYEIRAN